MNIDNREIAIQLSGVKKMYKLGQIGGGTLKADLQSWWAKKRGKEDPNTKIGEQRLIGQTFMALNGIDLTVYKGEALGIIGGNGAGKSTLLKLLSQVTAPTAGRIDLYGRVASMLEVGTGFNGEMTGRENIYMNGAILGMTKAEINAKMEDIIEFSEVRDFIDTPVKRYSSGMYVKLAFSVAAHLDSEIMIMDEVLAVGDMAFQKKCLDKMRDVAKKEGRTVLYVSHNMNTIRQLCDRCIVLDKGKKVFEGEVEKAISTYLNSNDNDDAVEKSLINSPRYLDETQDRSAKFTYMCLLGKENNQYTQGEKLKIALKWEATKETDATSIRFVFRNAWNTAVASSVCLDFGRTSVGENSYEFKVPLNGFVNGKYAVTLVLLERDSLGNSIEKDVVIPAFHIVIESANSLIWSPTEWGSIRLADAELLR